MPRCNDCPFGGKAIGSRGPKNAPIAIVGEAPGAQELLSGEPFIGPSGRLLHKQLNDAGIDLDACFVTNSLACRPPEGAKITRDAIEACKPRLLSELSLARRRLVISVGGTALRSLSEVDNAKIMVMRGHTFLHPLGFPVMPTIHPAAVLRNGSLLSMLHTDLQYAGVISRGNERRVEETNYVVVRDDEVERAIQGLMRCDKIAIDIETGSLDRKSPILAVGICWTRGKVLIFPWDIVERNKTLFQTLFDSSVTKVFHNGQFDAGFLVREGLNVHIDEDTILQHFLLDETPGTNGLKQLAAIELGADEWNDAVTKWVKAGSKMLTFQVVPRPILYKYLANDCDYTFQLHDLLTERLSADPKLVQVYKKLMIPATNFLREIETVGIHIDVQRIGDLNEELQTQIMALEQYMKDYTGVETFNANSPKQVAYQLYSVLRWKPEPEDLPYFQGTTQASDLDLLPQKPFINAIKTYRSLNRALDRYVMKLPTFKDDDNRVHSTIALFKTVTGRMSSADPPIQNVDSYDPEEEGSINYRSIFSAPNGRVFIEADYSQAELRTLAVLSRDPLLTETFKNGGDIHAEVATHLFGEGYTKTQRRVAKVLNFGTVYGLTAKNVAIRFRMSREEAQESIDKLFALMPRAQRYLNWCADHARTGKPIRSPLGRLRRFGLATQDNIGHLMNEAKNAPIQVTASDLTLMAAISMQPELRDRWGASIVNIVHDSLLIEAPDSEDDVCDISEFVSAVMQRVPAKLLHTDVPFVVDIAIGKNWGAMKK